MHAEAYRGPGGSRVDFQFEPPDKFKQAEAMLRSTPPATADPRSPEYRGMRCFRSLHAGMSLPLYVRADVQVGNTVVKGGHKIIRFNAVGKNDIGELVTDDKAVIERIEGHPWFASGVIVDAVSIHKAAKATRAIEIKRQIESDPMLREALVEQFGGETVENFLGAVEAVPTKKTKKTRN